MTEQGPVPGPPATLIDHISNGRCVLFVGAGLSAQAGLPTWPALIATMVDVLRQDRPDAALEEMEDLLNRGKLVEVAAYCREELGDRLYSEVLARQTRGDKVPIPAAHQAVAETGYSGIVTTNYDMLLERAYRDLGNNPKLPTHKDTAMLGPLLFSGDFFILKAHGDVDRPDTIVLTADDYRQVIHGNESFKALFSALLMTRALLFVGYSLSDPDFRLLLESSLTHFKEHTPERYALMANVGAIERRVLRQNTGIRVLTYRNESGGHEEVAKFLERIRDDAKGASLATRTTEETPTARSVVASAPPVAVRQRVEIRGDLRGLETRIEARDANIREVFRSDRPDWEKYRHRVREMDWMNSKDLDRAAALIGTLLGSEPIRVLERLDSQLSLILDLSPELEPIPWEWLPVGEDLLCSRYPVCRAPIEVSEEARGYPQIRQPVRLLMIGDPESNRFPSLPGARKEAELIVEMYRRAPDTEVTALIGTEASFSQIAHTMRQAAYDVIHFTGHAWADEDDAFLVLADAERLRPNEARSLLSSRPPAVMFINSHLAAFVPLGFNLSRWDRESQVFAEKEAQPPTGTERAGFTEMATNVGVGAFIGGLGAIGDESATLIGVEVHKRLLAGLSVADALRDARKVVAAERPGDTTWAQYVLSGRPDVRVTAQDD